MLLTIAGGGRGTGVAVARIWYNERSGMRGNRVRGPRVAFDG